MLGVTGPETGCTKMAKVPQKGSVFAFKDWGRNVWLGEPFPYFICTECSKGMSVYESYDQETKAYFTAKNVVRKCKV